MAVLLHTKEREKSSTSKGVKSMVKSCFLSPSTRKRNERTSLDDLVLPQPRERGRGREGEGERERENIRNLELIFGRSSRKFVR